MPPPLSKCLTEQSASPLIAAPPRPQRLRGPHLIPSKNALDGWRAHSTLYMLLADPRTPLLLHPGFARLAPRTTPARSLQVWPEPYHSTPPKSAAALLAPTTRYHQSLAPHPLSLPPALARNAPPSAPSASDRINPGCTTSTTIVCHRP